jgi:TPR repeat protein
MKMKLLLTIPLLSLLLTTSAGAGFDEGVAAYKHGDYATTLREFRPLAEQGDAKAQGLLGFMYDNGHGVVQDYAEAVKWYRKAAEQGNADAQSNLGNRYANGQGVVQDHAAAVKWYRKAAHQGYASAQYNLGVMYANGQSVVQDHAAVVMQFRKAQGNASALSKLANSYTKSNLGVMYSNGQGVVQDYVRAHMWFNIAASNGYKDAAKNRDIIAERMTPADFSKAQRMARDWVAAFNKRNGK